MSYFSDLDAWLEKLLEFEGGEDDEQWLERVTKGIKDEILKSYRNGQKAGLQPGGSTTDKPKQSTSVPERPKRRFRHGR